MGGFGTAMQILPMVQAASRTTYRSFACAKPVQLLTSQGKKDALEKLSARFGGLGWSEVCSSVWLCFH